MRDLIRSFFNRADDAPKSAAAPGSDHKLHVAACALLLEMAHADEEFDAEERKHIEEALGRHFGLEPALVKELIALADQQRQASISLFEFTSVINEHYDEGQRMVLVEVLWRVVLADGELSRHEDYLMRKIANLLDLRPGYLAEARKRAGQG